LESSVGRLLTPRAAPLPPAAQGGHKLRHSDTKVSALPSAEEILAEKFAVLAAAEPTSAGEGAGLAGAGAGVGAGAGAGAGTK